MTGNVLSLQPLHGNVLIERDDTPERSEGGIFLPQTAEVVTAQGKVVAVSKGRMLDTGKYADPQVAVGDVVYFNPAKGTSVEVVVKSKKMLVMDERNILAIVKPEAV